MNDTLLLMVTARLLRQGGRTDLLSCALMLLAFAVGWFALGTGDWLRLAFLLGVIVLGLVQRYFALRVAFDADLFEALAAPNASNPRETRDAKPGPERMRDFDKAMQTLELMPADKSARPWAERCRGALKLMNRQIMVVLLQFAVAIAGIVTAVLS